MYNIALPFMRFMNANVVTNRHKVTGENRSLCWDFLPVWKSGDSAVDEMLHDLSALCCKLTCVKCNILLSKMTCDVEDI